MNQRHSKFIACVIAMMFASASYAQDFGSLLKDVLSNRVRGVDDVLGAIRSIADVSLSQLSAGMDSPTDADGKVILYRTAGCGYCKRAAAHMQQREIAFSERDIAANPSYRKEYDRLGGNGGVPLIVMGRKTMAGFSAEKFDTAYAEFQPAAATKPRLIASANELAGTPAPAGGVWRPRIGNVKVYELPSAQSRVMAIVQKSEELVASGEAQDGFLKVDAADFSGAWVQRTLIAPTK